LLKEQPPREPQLDERRVVAAPARDRAFGWTLFLRASNPKKL
jgi:hypothetical protein